MAFWQMTSRGYKTLSAARSELLRRRDRSSTLSNGTWVLLRDDFQSVPWPVLAVHGKKEAVQSWHRNHAMQEDAHELKTRLLNTLDRDGNVSAQGLFSCPAGEESPPFSPLILLHGGHIFLVIFP